MSLNYEIFKTKASQFFRSTWKLPANGVALCPAIVKERRKAFWSFTSSSCFFFCLMVASSGTSAAIPKIVLLFQKRLEAKGFYFFWLTGTGKPNIFRHLKRKMRYSDSKKFCITQNNKSKDAKCQNK